MSPARPGSPARYRGGPPSTWSRGVFVLCVFLQLVALAAEAAHADALAPTPGEIHLHAPGDQDDGCQTPHDDPFCQLCRALSAGVLTGAARLAALYGTPIPPISADESGPVLEERQGTRARAPPSIG